MSIVLWKAGNGSGAQFFSPAIIMRAPVCQLCQFFRLSWNSDYCLWRRLWKAIFEGFLTENLSISLAQRPTYVDKQAWVLKPLNRSSCWEMFVQFWDSFSTQSSKHLFFLPISFSNLNESVLISDLITKIIGCKHLYKLGLIPQDCLFGRYSWGGQFWVH